ncbi:hypothetical protein REPUB_Repub02eG0275800 [Reevesia pubescens]
MAEEDIYTKDGTTDFRNKPDNKTKTGTWKACPYILGTCYVMPLIGAFLADAYLGRYWTIASFSIIYVFGMTILTMSASIHGLKPACDENNIFHPTGLQTGVFFLGLYLIALGTGMIKPCVSSFGADQFDDSDDAEKKKMGLGVWHSSCGYGYCRCKFLFRKIRLELPADKSLLYETVDEESAAAVETSSDQIKGSINPWRLCTSMGTLFVLQGDTMDLHMARSFEIPSSSLSLFDTISVIFWVPVYDRLIVPLARKFTGHKNGFTQLQRIAIGLVISIFAMLAAGTLELVRLCEVKKHNYYELKHMPMSIFWQVPQYFIIGCAEVFTFIGQLEFFYEQAPDAMRSLLSLTTAALGNYLSTFLVNIVTDFSSRQGNPGWIPDNLNYGHLHYFFWLLAVLSILNLGVYVMVARWYTYKKAVVLIN